MSTSGDEGVRAELVFRTNLEYLAAHIEYLRALAALRLRGQRPRTGRDPLRPPACPPPRPAVTRHSVAVMERRLAERIRATLAAATTWRPRAASCAWSCRSRAAWPA